MRQYENDEFLTLKRHDFTHTSTLFLLTSGNLQTKGKNELYCSELSCSEADVSQTFPPLAWRTVPSHRVATPRHRCIGASWLTQTLKYKSLRNKFWTRRCRAKRKAHFLLITGPARTFLPPHRVSCPGVFPAHTCRTFGCTAKRAMSPWARTSGSWVGPSQGERAARLLSLTFDCPTRDVPPPVRAP